MKLVMVMLLASGSVLAMPAGTKKTLPVTKAVSIVKNENKKNKELKVQDKKAADCDDKAKKPVEITPESINLSGTTGCSLDEAH
jgi:hypothetical protein